MRARSLFVGLLIALLVGSAFLFWRFFGDKNPRAIRDSSQAIASAQRGLAKLGTASEGAEPSTEVPSEAFKQLQNEKHQMRDLIRSVLNSEAPNASSEQLRNAVLQPLGTAGVRLSDAAAAGPDAAAPKPLYGDLSLRLERVLGQKNLVAARVGTGLPCGTDNALYIYERDGAVWSLVLAYEAPEYKSTKDGYGALDYVISPSKDNNWYAFVASVTPACTSTWQGLRYTALRKGSDPDHPKAILDVTTGLYEGWEEFWKLRAESEVAQITWPYHFNLDGTILIRAHVARYKVEGDNATRIPPVALYPEDFVDEWAQQPWEESKDWVAPEALDEAASIHKWLHGSDIAGTINFIQSCPIPDHWQIGFTLEGTGTQKPPMGTLFVDVSRDGDIFRLDRIAADRAPGCPGDELPPQRQQSLP